MDALLVIYECMTSYVTTLTNHFRSIKMKEITVNVMCLINHIMLTEGKKYIYNNT